MSKLKTAVKEIEMFIKQEVDVEPGKRRDEELKAGQICQTTLLELHLYYELHNRLALYNTDVCYY